MKRWLVCLLLIGCRNSTPPQHPVSHVIVRLDVPVVGMPPLDQCRAICPAPASDEALAYCHVAAVSSALMAHRQQLGEKPSDHALVCAYGPP